MVDAIVTVSQKSKTSFYDYGKKIASTLGLSFVPRENRSIQTLKDLYEVENVLVLTSSGPKLYADNKNFHHFHLSMAQLRLIKLAKGESDHLIEAIGLDSLDSFLDCTVGLGADSLVVSYAYPNCKHIIGLEGKKELAYITNYGMRNFNHNDELITNALRRVQIISIRYEDYFKYLADDSVDVIYLDPMFASPVMDSPQFKSLRGYTITTPLTVKLLSQALTKCKYKVIIKDRSFSSFFRQCKPTHIIGGKYSRIAYGVYEKTVVEGKYG